MTTVSVIVPCFNEENTILLLLAALREQSYPLTEMEVLIADGHSTDRTRERIAEFQKANPQLAIRVLDNDARTIPSGLNTSIAQAKGEIILRLDAHCVPQTDYVQRSVEGLEQGKGWNVGGVWDIRARAQNWMAEAIAAAASQPLAVGDARYRYAEKAQAVDTVPFGAFYRKLVEETGPFDESLKSNEDYEFNARIRKAGGTVWLDPAIRSIYFARPNFLALARQYARYGYWKWRMLRRYPGTLRLRQALPPLFVAALIGLPILSIWWPWLLIPWWVAVVSYALLLVFFALIKALQMSKPSFVIGLPMAMASMHLPYGGALLWSMIHSNLSRN